MRKICILGSGAGGGILALELSRIFDGEICLIDIDSGDERPENTAPLETEYISDLDHTGTRGFGLGGGSNFWHGVVTTLDQSDSKANDDEAGVNLSEELNLGWKELVKYFPKAMELLSLNKSEYQNRIFKKLPSFVSKKYLVHAFPLRLRKLIKAETLINPRFNYMKNSIALKLNVNNLGLVESVTCKRNNEPIHINADIFILALGAIENPRILLQSFNGTHFFNRSVGKNLLDHPFSIIGRVKTAKKIIYRMHGHSSIISGTTMRFGYIKANPLAGENHSIFIKPATSVDIQTTRENIRRLIYSRINSMLIIDILKSKSMLRTAFYLMCEKFGIGSFTNMFDLSVQFEMSRKDNAFVELSNRDDPYGRKVPIVHYMVPKRYLENIKNLQLELGHVISGQESFQPYSLCDISFIGGAHYSGTCRVGIDPEVSVVNSDLKVHGLQNLYICDASVIGNIGNANLFLTIALHAIRLAKHLSKR